MKKIVCALLFLTVTAFIAFAQGANNAQMLKRLGLSDDQISQFSVIQQQALPDIQAGQADMRQAKKQLAQLLIDPKADPKEVERLVHAATDAEARIKVAQIRREMAIRQLIGDRKWQKLVLYVRVRRALLRGAMGQNAPDGAARAGAAAADSASSGAADAEGTQALLQDLLSALGEDASSPTR